MNVFCFFTFEKELVMTRKHFLATLALGLALVVRIHEAYGTIEEDEIFARDGEI